MDINERQPINKRLPTYDKQKVGKKLKIFDDPVKKDIWVAELFLFIS